MSDLFADYLPKQNITPRTEKEWNELYVLLGSTFSPHQPINDRDLFVGRIDIISKVVDSVHQAGRHVVLYGDRGVGKSSLANSIRSTLQRMSNQIYCTKRSCTFEHDFAMIWKHLLDDFQIDGRPASEIIGNNPNPYDIYKIIRDFPLNKKMVFIIDEFDRVQDERTKQLMSDLIKYLSDNDERTTVILVGVAKSIQSLFENHGSLPRAMQQIYMPRMDASELKEIITSRLPSVGMSLGQKSLDETVALSQGFPGFTHLIALSAARHAVRRRTVEIADFDLQEALKIVVEDSDETVKTAYHNAVQSTKPMNLYREVLLACALASTDERNRFTAKGITVPLSHIMGRRLEMTSFGRNLSQFCAEDRGPTLIREGSPKNYHFYFEYALLKPFVIIKGLSDGTIHSRHMS